MSLPMRGSNQQEKRKCQIKMLLKKEEVTKKQHGGHQKQTKISYNSNQDRYLLNSQKYLLKKILVSQRHAPSCRIPPLQQPVTCFIMNHRSNYHTNMKQLM